jgi:hypothetical protein
VRTRSLKKRPREMKTQEGTRMTVGRIRPSDIADSGLEHDPEVDATIAGAGQPAGERRERREGDGHRRGGTASLEEANP